jgi:hypothetical protein
LTDPNPACYNGSMENNPWDLKAPFPWFGGKSKCSEEVWKRLGAVQNYVEPFAGSLAVLLNRPTDKMGGLETVNNKDAYVANFWRAIQNDPEEVAKYATYPVSEPDLHARHFWLVKTADERAKVLCSDPDYFSAKVAGWWVWGISCWIGSGWCSGTLHKEFTSTWPRWSRS